MQQRQLQNDALLKQIAARHGCDDETFGAVVSVLSAVSLLAELNGKMPVVLRAAAEYSSEKQRQREEKAHIAEIL